MLVIFLIAGLIVGSFLNVLVYRLRMAEELVFDRSHCPHCRKNIRWYDNIPVLSFILLKAKCRDCKKKISWQYPIVEIATGIIFALIGWKFFALNNMETWTPAAYYWVISSVLIAILVYDWLYMEIPTAVLWSGVGLAVAFNLFSDWSNSLAGGGILEGATYSGTLAAFLAFLFFFLLASKSKEKWMGMGDALLVILLGLILGWPEILLALFAAFFIGSIYGIIMIGLKKKKMKSQVPFAPFLIAGSFITLFFYAAITNWYFGLFY